MLLIRISSSIRVTFLHFTSHRSLLRFSFFQKIMRYAAAYVLATLAGNSSPDASTISKILGSVGIDSDQSKAQKVVEACKGKSLDQIIEEGMKKLSSLPAGGGAAPAAAAGGAAQAATTDAKKGGAKEEPKKEEKKAEKESDDEGDDMVRRNSFSRRSLN